MQRMVDDKAKGGWTSGKRRMATKQLHHVPMPPNEAALGRGAVAFGAVFGLTQQRCLDKSNAAEQFQYVVLSERHRATSVRLFLDFYLHNIGRQNLFD